MENLFLYPCASETRQIIDLSGIWNFQVDFENKGREKEWYQGLPDPTQVPVPASFNDLFTDKEIRDHVGDVWYETEFYAAPAWQEKIIYLRFGSATHRAEVWINGIKIISHEGGYMPFGEKINEAISYGEKNKMIVVVNNELDYTTIPCGKIREYEDGSRKLFPFFDFFNYSGLHASVKLMLLPEEFIKDISIITDFEDETGFIEYEVETSGSHKVKIEVENQEGKVVSSGQGKKGKIKIEQVKLWQPGNAYLYNFKVKIKEGKDTIDSYPLPVGVRTVEVQDNCFYINDKPFYCKGFGKHQDSEYFGRGYNPAVMIRDAELLEWIGANSVRTSHYPYDEEFYRLCDRKGIVVIDETPAVGMFDMHMNFLGGGSGDESQFFERDEVQEETRANHKRAIRRLMQRDKNHPAVVMWCLANEPDTSQEESEPYFEDIFEYAGTLDPQQRPLTFTNFMKAPYGRCHAAQFADVLLLNRYYGWYLKGGVELEYAKKDFIQELKAWEQENKPIIISEYGADTMAGIHKLPRVQWSEEYQTEYLKLQHQVFDEIDSIIGEQVWNFADFQTIEGIMRVDGNKKGIFTRTRQPKQAAYLLKERWENISGS